uniref:Uncharacterized protein n=1 Tax=Setaria viridis TaxID=4556 RepID=A0A4U6W882_SETVI|nr:hypothetical protein SEVIR_1G144000v2 [Setaria viridis]
MGRRASLPSRARRRPAAPLPRLATPEGLPAALGALPVDMPPSWPLRGRSRLPLRRCCLASRAQSAPPGSPAAPRCSPPLPSKHAMALPARAPRRRRRHQPPHRPQQLLPASLVTHLGKASVGAHACVVSPAPVTLPAMPLFPLCLPMASLPLMAVTARAPLSSDPPVSREPWRLYKPRRRYLAPLHLSLHSS